MSAARLTPLPTIDAQTLKRRLDQRSVTLIDVREPGEFAGEHIPGATLVPLSQFDLRKIPQVDNTQLVVYCLTGQRSAIAGQKLLAAGFVAVAHLPGGLADWQAARYPTVINRQAPMSLMRQVQIVAGSLVFTGTVLGALVSPWFLLLSGFVGAGLVFAGVSNTCMLARLLAKLPYNQRSQA
ncbi:MAG: rhodanese-like domain-containing protein [Leptolyngbyaceae cyanobacterium]